MWGFTLVKWGEDVHGHIGSDSKNEITVAKKDFSCEAARPARCSLVLRHYVSSPQSLEVADSL